MTETKRRRASGKKQPTNKKKTAKKNGRGGVDPIPHIEFRPGAYAPGRNTVTRILEAALDILIDEGIRTLTLRRIATACDLRIGNVTYHFATKNQLLQAVLDIVSAGYTEALRTLTLRADEPPELRLGLLISFILKDIQTKTTTNLFPELWALANHDAFVADCINNIYQRGRALLIGLIGEINPALDAEEREAVATFIQAATEGMTIFVGHKRPMARRFALIESISVKVLVDLVRDIDSEIIRAGIKRTA